MILVIGATGVLGGEICRRLVASGRPVRALVRPTSDAGAVDALRRLGVELATGDLKDGASLDAACGGATAVISTATTITHRQADDSFQRVDLAGQNRLIDAARSAGVAHFVYTSFSGNFEVENPLQQAKRAVERHLRESGLTYTILRPSAFMEVWLGPHTGFDMAGGRVRVYGTGRNPLSYISFFDVAQFAVESLNNPAARNATLELGGPEPASPLEIVHMCEEVSGRPFEVQFVPEEALQAQLAQAADPVEQTFAGLMLSVARGDPIPMQETLHRFPIRLTSVREFVTRSLRPPAASGYEVASRDAAEQRTT